MTRERFRYLLTACGVRAQDHVLAAVSGGADSMALLYLLSREQEEGFLRVSCACIDHRIRESAAQEAAFVAECCGRLGIAFIGGSVDAPRYAKETGCGLEDAARQLRHAALARIAGEIGASCVAYAHHRDDQAETVLQHAARGSALRGLGGMRMRREDGGFVQIRPLLEEEPAELRRLLLERGMRWMEDESNRDPAFTRNRIRSEVLPSLEQAYPGARASLTRLARCAQRDEDYLSAQVDALGVRLIPLADGCALQTQGLAGLHEALLSRVVVRLIEAVPAQASGLVIERLTGAIRRGETGAAFGVGSVGGQAVQARFGEKHLCITRPYCDIADTPLLMQGETKTPFGTFIVREAKDGETGDGVTCQTVPARLMKDARVCVRREGDAMIPFGRHTPAKVKKLLIDAGVERAMRRSIPVVRCREGILWLAGLRASALCAAQGEEKRMMIVFRRAECVKIQDQDKFQEGITHE